MKQEKINGTINYDNISFSVLIKGFCSDGAIIYSPLIISTIPKEFTLKFWFGRTFNAKVKKGDIFYELRQFTALFYNPFIPYAEFVSYLQAN